VRHRWRPGPRCTHPIRERPGVRSNGQFTDDCWCRRPSLVVAMAPARCLAAAAPPRPSRCARDHPQPRLCCAVLERAWWCGFSQIRYTEWACGRLGSRQSSDRRGHHGRTVHDRTQRNRWRNAVAVRDGGGCGGSAPPLAERRHASRPHVAPDNVKQNNDLVALVHLNTNRRSTVLPVAIAAAQMRHCDAFSRKWSQSVAESGNFQRLHWHDRGVYGMIRWADSICRR